MALRQAERPITKEQYERAQEHNGYIAEEDLKDIFSNSDIYGYGIYCPVACARYNARTNETTYVVTYSTGTSCD